MQRERIVQGELSRSHKASMLSLVCRLHQLVAHVDQARTEEIVLFLRALTVIHHGFQICRLFDEVIRSPADESDQNSTIIKQNQ